MRSLRPPGAVMRFLLVGVVLVLRRPDSLHTPQFWAEDSTIFFQRAFEHPAIGTLAEPYAGYFHVVPRAVALVTVWCVEPEWAPLIFNAAAIAIAAICLSLFGSRRFRRTVRSDWARLAACLLAAHVHPSVEILSTLTNVHWYMTLAAPLLLIMPVHRRRDAALAAAAMAASGLSCPLLLFALPAAIIVLLRRRGAGRLPAGMLTLAILLHVALVFFVVPESGRRPVHWFPAEHVARHVAHRARALVLYSVMGEWPAERLLRAAPKTAAVIAVAAPAGVLAWLAVLSRRRQLACALAGVLLALVWLIVQVPARASLDPSPARNALPIRMPLQTRFAFVPYCVAVFCGACAWDAARRRRRRLDGRVIRGALLVMLACGVLFRVPSPPPPDLHWRDHVRRARAAGWAADIPINPRDLNWTLRLRGRGG